MPRLRRLHGCSLWAAALGYGPPGHREIFLLPVPRIRHLVGRKLLLAGHWTSFFLSLPRLGKKASWNTLFFTIFSSKRGMATSFFHLCPKSNLILKFMKNFSCFIYVLIIICYNLQYSIIKGGFLTIYEQILSEHQRLSNQINSLQSQLKAFPTGKLVCTRNASRYKWYRSNGKKSTYIPKKQKGLAEQLAIKKYLTCLLEDSLHEQKALEFYLRHHAPGMGKAEQLLTTPSEFQALLSNHFKPADQEKLLWMNSPYERNPNYPEQLTHRTYSGYYVRSKSELLIDMALRTHKLPFRYECALELEDVVLYPDFTILHPLSGEYIYWEHFGIMDDPDYRQSFYSKIRLYTSHGIIPNINLLTTFETKQHPLDTEQIEHTIQTFLL